MDFFHWIVINIPSTIREIAEGADSKAVTAKGKSPGVKPYGVTGIKNYTDWFASDLGMAGVYGGYDGPCPPWNDSIVYNYHLTLYAVNIQTLDVKDTFGGQEVLKAIKGHVIEKASYSGTYSLNPDLMV